MTLRLDLRGISKRYPSVVANDGISLQVQAGEIHAVLGENGAGKSTLMKIIYGAVMPDSGEIIFNGHHVQVKSPQHARTLGISMVFQHFSLFETFTVAQNVWLGLQSSLSLDEVSALIAEKAQAYGLEIDPNRPVHTLGVGEMQRVEIIRALLTEPQMNPLPCSPHKPWKSSLKCSNAFRPRVAAFCTSATNSMKFASCAATARCLEVGA